MVQKILEWVKNILDMKKNNKKIIIDKYGLCLNEYKDNLNNA